MSVRDVVADAFVGIGGDAWTRGEKADTILAALRAAGYVVVPVEPTWPMRKAGLAERKRGHTMPQIWTAMLAAATPPPSPARDGVVE